MQTVRYASLKTSIHYIPKSGVYVVRKNFPGRYIVKKIYQYLFDVMIHNKFLAEHQERVEVNTFDYTPEKRKLISEHIMNLIYNYEYDYFITVSPYNHVIVCGEEDFFRIVKEPEWDNSIPFFSKEEKFPLDIRRNGRLLGFMIHICPGLSGVAILPKVIIQK